MNDFSRATSLAFHIIIDRDPELVDVVWLSLRVSLTASIIAFLLGLPLGGWLATTRFRGRTAVLVFVNAALGLPPVVVGLVLYLVLSRSGPLGSFGLLFTPSAMIAAQSLLAFPIAAGLTHRALEGSWSAYGEALIVDGASKSRAVLTLLNAKRAALVTVYLAAFGRAIAEVGAILIVGGNIRGFTRTMTTSIALETSTGELPLALALGMILVGISVAVSAVAFAVGRLFERR